MDNALRTLFYPYEGDLDHPKTEDSVLFLNAAYDPALERFKSSHLHLQQYFKPFANVLQDQGFHVASEIEEAEEQHDLVLIKLPKNQIESQYLIAQGLKALKTGGMILCAADNKAGGTRIAKTLKAFGIENVQDESKNKARVCMAIKQASNNDNITEALNAGKTKKIPNSRFISKPGIFGWDKVDKGSDLLLKHLPVTLSGKGADFGCGYGFLSDHVLAQCEGVTELSCLDADYRAILTCQQNLESFDTPKRFFWEDLTQEQPGLFDLDFIVMNPPFHEEKRTDSDIGKAFIQRASESLKPAGKLYMVANVQLPYEDALAEHFQTVKNLAEENDFKVFEAVK